MVELTRKQASASNGGELNDGVQTIAGDKTYTGEVVIAGMNAGDSLGEGVDNILINGDLDLWQRGVGPVSTSTEQYLADRWKNIRSGFTTWQIQRSSDVPTFAQSGHVSQYSLEVEATGTKTPDASSNSWMQYVVEGYDFKKIQGRKATLSFWVKSHVAGTYGVSLHGGGYSKNVLYTINAALTWEKIELTIDFDQITGSWNYDNSAGVTLTFQLINQPGAASETSNADVWESGTFWTHSSQTNLFTASGNKWAISQIMLVPGEAAPSKFKAAGRSFQEELAMAQRYFEKTYNLDVPVGTGGGAGYLLSAVPPSYSNVIPDQKEMAHEKFRVTKRAAATVTVYSAIGGTAGQVSNGSGTNIGPVDTTSGFSNPPSTAGFSIMNNSGGNITTNQDVITYHWAADAEL